MRQFEIADIRREVGGWMIGRFPDFFAGKSLFGFFSAVSFPVLVGCSGGEGSALERLRPKTIRREAGESGFSVFREASLLSRSRTTSVGIHGAWRRTERSKEERGRGHSSLAGFLLRVFSCTVSMHGFSSRMLRCPGSKNGRLAKTSCRKHGFRCVAGCVEAERR